MDSIFRLEDGERATYLYHLMRTLGSTYICLWSVAPQSTNSLISKAGFYNEEIVRFSAASTSHGTTRGQRLFDEYRQFFFDIRDLQVPGLAFKNGNPLMELKDGELQRLVSTETQMQFYQEAKIKRAVFMGCKAGEVELGFSIDHPQVNLEAVLRNWFPEDFSQQAPPSTLSQIRPSSSESSLHSLSMDSSECSPFLFAMQNTPLAIEPTLRPTFMPHQNTLSPLHQALLQPFGNNPQLIPTSSQDVNEAMTKAILAVLSASSSPPNSSTSSTPQDLGINNPLSQRNNFSAFKKFDSGLGSSPLLGVRRQNMIKKSIGFFRALNYMRQSQERVQRARPNTTQMHHMISERKRREKLNESFETLRLLLPTGTKKDKATVLKRTTECIASLKAQVAELTQKIKNLDTRISHQRGSQEENRHMLSNERLHVHITNLPETTSQGRVVDLQVLVRGEVSNLDLVIRVLEFLKHIENIEVMSIEADMMVDESSLINRMVLRLKLEGDDWDQSTFQEAVRRVVADMVE